MPVEGYVVDFFCTAARLIVEADGPHHNTPAQRAIDMHRDAVLRQHGLRVLRLSGDLILSDLERAVDEIRHALRPSPTSDP